MVNSKSVNGRMGRFRDKTLKENKMDKFPVPIIFHKETMSIFG